MRMSVCRVYVWLSLAVLGVVAAPAASLAQVRPYDPSGDAVGEDYHVEAAYGWWNATPELFVQSEALGILGTRINLIDDLGIEQHKLGKLDIVLRPAKKHRFLFERLPIKYTTDAFPVTREFIFNGQRYTIGLPVDQFTCIFAMSRIAGWSTQILEQLADNRLIRPKESYVGKRDQTYVPLADR